MVSKIDQTIQGNLETHIFKCYCGENSYLEIIKDYEDRQIYINITQHPTRLIERLQLAWKVLKGLEFSSSNEIVIDEKDIDSLIKGIKL